MKIGIIGAGTVGTTLGDHFAAAGHDIFIASRRAPESLAADLQKAGHPFEPVTFAELIERAELFVLAVPWRNVRDLLNSDIDWRGRVLIDTTNIILGVSPTFDVDDLDGDSGSELVARLASSACVVKAFNTLPFDIMFIPAQPGFRRVLFIAGDAPDAISTIADLINEIGFHAVTIGDLATAGRQMEIGGPFSRLELFAAESRSS
jgi:hypothetical protein